jgi:Tol biopolymer transport system component
MKKSALFLVCAGLLFVWGCPGAVFHSERDGRAQIYKTDDSGILQGNISNNPYQDRYPDVSPDTWQVVFSNAYFICIMICPFIA